MRIFQIVTVSEYGGAQSVVLNLSEALCQENEVFLLYGGDGDAWKNLNSKIKKIKIDEHRKDLSIKDLFLMLRLFYYRLKYNPDVIHLHSSKIGALGRLVFSKKKVVYTVHGFDSVRVAHRKFLFVEKLLKSRAAKIIGVSKYDVEGLKSEGITRNVELVYNGLRDSSQLNNLDPDLAITQKLNEIKQNYPKVIMCISRISKQKKFDLFLEIAKAMSHYAFVWIGNKQEMSNLPDNVYCLGETSLAQAYLKYANLFILPTNYEGLPVSILESLSYSVPVIASTVGGIPEILNGENGFCVSNDVESFVDKIEYSLSDDNNKRMSVAARKSYEEKFTIDKMIAGYKTVFEKTIT